MTKWTKEDKEWLGYRRRMSVQDRGKISLSKPPWAKGEQHGNEHVEERREGMELSSKEQASRKRRGSKRV